MKNRFRSLSFGVAGMVIAAITLAAVMGSAQAAPGAAARMSVRSSEYGKTLFGPTGKVVYVFGADRGSTSWCYGVCAKAWPPLLTTAAPLAGPGAKAGLLGTTKRKDGKLQVTSSREALLRALPLAVLIPTLALTQSRGSWAALAAGLAVLLTARFRLRRGRVLALAVALAAGASVIALLTGSGFFGERSSYWRVAWHEYLVGAVSARSCRYGVVELDLRADAAR
jgi:predicted lipoprotein with Yx(FWY)xxD motif